REPPWLHEGLISSTWPSSTSTVTTAGVSKYGSTEPEVLPRGGVVARNPLVVAADLQVGHGAPRTSSLRTLATWSSFFSSAGGTSLSSAQPACPRCRRFL